MVPYKTGDCVAFQYESTSGDTVRWVQVLKIRDLAKTPLAAVTLAIDPEFQRGTLLIYAFDLQKCAVRRFYWEKMTNPQLVAAPDWVLARYDPSNPDEEPQPVPTSVLGPNPTMYDLFILMRAGNSRAALRPHVHRLLGLFASHAMPKLGTNVGSV